MRMSKSILCSFLLASSLGMPLLTYAINAKDVPIKNLGFSGQISTVSGAQENVRTFRTQDGSVIVNRLIGLQPGQVVDVTVPGRYFVFKDTDFGPAYGLFTRINARAGSSNVRAPGMSFAPFGVDRIPVVIFDGNLNGFRDGWIPADALNPDTIAYMHEYDDVFGRYLSVKDVNGNAVPWNKNFTPGDLKGKFLGWNGWQNCTYCG